MIDGLTQNWSYAPSSTDMLAKLRRARGYAVGLRPRPAWLAMTPISQRAHWNVLFLYLKDRALTAAQTYTLAALRKEPGGLAVICAADQPSDVPTELHRLCDALYWKARPGFDFSGYAIALSEINEHSSGADVFIMNDSVYGPFAPLQATLNASPWRLTGFTAHCAVENHIQSYAFHIKRYDKQTHQHLKSIFPARFAYHYFQNVVHCQETRLARVASRYLSAGAFWHQGTNAALDPTLTYAAQLLDDGLPFLKKSLLSGKFSDRYPNGHFNQYLNRFGHPHDRR